jgi:adenylate cyclase
LGDGDFEAAGAAVDRLAAVTSGYTFEKLTLLRQHALLAKACDDHVAYRRFRDQYRTMAGELGFEGHLAIADAMD